MYVPNVQNHMHKINPSEPQKDLFSCDCLEAKHQPKTGSIQKQDDANHTALDFNTCHLSYHIPVLGYIFRFIYMRTPWGNPRKRRCKGSAIHIAALKSDSELLERLLDMQVPRFCRDFFLWVPMGFLWFPAFLQKRNHEGGLWGKICQVGQWGCSFDSNWFFQVSTSFCWNQLQSHDLQVILFKWLWFADF